MQSFHELHDLHDLPNAGHETIARRSYIAMHDPQQTAPPGSGFTPDDRFVFDVQMVSDRPGGPDPREESRRIIEEARQTAEHMLQQAREACVAELESARQRGYEAGYADGMEAADRETAGTIAAADAIAANIARERDEAVARSEGDLVQLALAVAEKIVCGVIEVEPDRVLDVCRGAMRKAFQRDTLTVLACPADLELLRAAGPEMAAELGGIHSIEFVEERRLQSGSVIVRTPAGEIDATASGKLDVIRDGLLELAAERRAELRSEGTSQSAA